MSYPTETEIRENQNNYNPDESAHYPKFSKVHKYPDPYKNVGQRINTEPNKYKPKVNPKPKVIPKPKVNPKSKPKMNLNPNVYKHKHQGKVKKVPVPVTKYVAVPVGPPMLMPVITQKNVPVYPQVQPQPLPQQMYPQAPYGGYNYGYNYNYPTAQYNYANPVKVIPPGYQPDYSPGYTPYGNIIDDFINIF